jgi:hypothetical protein
LELTEKRLHRPALSGTLKIVYDRRLPGEVSVRKGIVLAAVAVSLLMASALQREASKPVSEGTNQATLDTGHAVVVAGGAQIDPDGNKGR